MPDKRIKPFLRWAGGKQWLSLHLSTLIGDCNGTYFEPFLGGASAYFSARPQNAVLSDLNERLIETYQQLKHTPHDVISLLDQWKNDEDTYYTIRDAESSDTIRRAAQFIFLNRTCWNGLYRVNRQGYFNVPFGHHGRAVFEKQHLLDVSRALQNAELHHADFDDVLVRAQESDCIYLDPPYTSPHHPNGFRQYNESSFTWHDQERLAETAVSLSDRGCRVIISNADHESILELYRGFSYQRVHRHSILAASSKYRRPTTELILASDATLLPLMDVKVTPNL